MATGVLVSSAHPFEAVTKLVIELIKLAAGSALGIVGAGWSIVSMNFMINQKNAI